MSLKKKKFLLAVSGSIAAYKAVYLLRSLIKLSAEVKVIMTQSATKFVSPLSFSTLSGHEVFIDVTDGESWNNHVELGLWADAMIVAPATANTLAKMAHGISDNVIVTTYLSAKCPVFFAPAMDRDMWQHPSTQNNIKTLQSYGNHLIPVGDGELASGLKGKGRMAEPDEIVELMHSFFSKKKALSGKSVIITAGPTYEKIDPVRFIGNHSSGKMGYALAQACAQEGANVKLILGPNSLGAIDRNIELIPVSSAQEMYEAAIKHFPKSDIAIMAAAVADYRPKKVSSTKIKKKAGDMSIELERTIDIAASLGAQKKKHQMLIGFALETNDEQSNAERKLSKKNFDFIVLNSLKDKGAGFKHDTNKISIIFKGNKLKKYKLKSKQEVASDIVNEIIRLKK